MDILTSNYYMLCILLNINYAFLWVANFKESVFNNKRWIGINLVLAITYFLFGKIESGRYSLIHISGNDIYNVNYSLNYINGWLFKSGAIFLALLLIRFVFYRFFKQKVQALKNIFKKDLNYKDQRTINLKLKTFDVTKYLTKESIKEKKYLIGIDEDKKPLYVPQSKLGHPHISGRTGSGKTESAIKPLAIQTILMGDPVVMIDGKGDMGLIRDINGFFKRLSKKTFQNFNATQVIVNGEPYDVFDTSATFNPLLALDSPIDLVDMFSKTFDMESDGPSNFYFEIEKGFLLLLFKLFQKTGLKYTFEDILEYVKFERSREYVRVLAEDNGGKSEVIDMNMFLGGLKNGTNDLMGLSNKIDQLFVSNETISRLVNVYNPDIDILDTLNKKNFLLFSLSSGDQYQSNNAIAKMVVSIMASLIGKKEGIVGTRDFWFFILEEFGQYPTKVIGPLITTARGTNTSVALSYQEISQLEKVGLESIAIDQTDTKYIFKSQKTADDWARFMGTVQSYKRTDVAEDDAFMTESREGKSSHREVDEFNIDPNIFRSLTTGKSVFAYTPEDGTKGFEAKVINHGKLNFPKKRIFLANHKVQDDSIGLNLRKKRIRGDFSPSVPEDSPTQERVEKKEPSPKKKTKVSKQVKKKKTEPQKKEPKKKKIKTKTTRSDAKIKKLLLKGVK